MDGNLTWTEQLGDAFLAEQPAVMDSVQRLRQRAEAAGRLQSTPQALVSNDAGVIIIEPPDQNIVYVPVYDPNVVYGAWPYPDYPPDYFPGFFPDATIGPLGVGWVGVGVVAPLFGWAICDWGHHLIRNDTHRFGASNAGPDVWQHDPSHRGGVPYRDPAVRAQFQSAATAAAIQGARGIPIVAPAAMTTPTGVAAPPFAESAPAVVRSAPRVMQSIGSVPQVPAQVERGQAGRMLAPAPRALAPPHRAVPAAPVPRVVMAVPAARGGASAPRAAPAPYGNAVHR
jgi:hypothetical protein